MKFSGKREVCAPHSHSKLTTPSLTGRVRGGSEGLWFCGSLGLLISIPIFILILQHRKIRGIATLTDVMPFNSFTHGTTWLVGMCAVVETAILGKIENLLEVMPHFLAFHVEGTKAFDAWRVDDIRAWHERILYRVHLREGGGMLTRIEGIGNLTCP